MRDALVHVSLIISYKCVRVTEHLSAAHKASHVLYWKVRDCRTTLVCSALLSLSCAWSRKQALVATLLGAGGSAAQSQPCGAEWACPQGMELHWAGPWWTGEHHHCCPHPEVAEPCDTEPLGRRVPCARALVLPSSLAGATVDDGLHWPSSRGAVPAMRAPDHAHAEPQAERAASGTQLRRLHARHAPDEAHAAEEAQRAAPALLQGPGARLAPDPARVRPHRRLLQIGVVQATLAPALLSPATVSALAGVLQLAARAGAAPATNAAATGVQIANAAVDAATVLASAGLQYVVQHLPATPSPDGGPQAPVQTLAGGPGPALGPATGGASAAPMLSDGSASSGSSWLAGIGVAAPQAAPPDTTTVSALGDNSGGSKIATVLIALLPASCFVLLGALLKA